MHVGVMAIPGTFDSAFTSVLDILRTAESMRPGVDRTITPIESSIIGLRPAVRTALGLLVECERTIADPMDDLDVLVVPTLGVRTSADVDAALQRPDVRELREALRTGSASVVPKLAGACSGTFVLAEAGRLDGMRAATSWWLSGTFARLYPTVELDSSRMVVHSGSVTTAGAAFAHIDLAMSLVAQVSERLAEVVAHHLLVDERPARSSEALVGHLSANDVLVTRFEDEVRERIAEPLAIPELADALGVTRRTLERHVRQRTGLSPNAFVRRLRVERANHLRRTTELSMGQVAQRVGYTSAVTLRRAIARET